MKLIKTVLLISAFAVAAIANAQTCDDSITPTTPDNRFSDNGDGTVTDKTTNLIWMRCALGQTWDGSTCTGSATTYTWQQALQEAEGYTFAGSSGWRVPSIKELASIVELSCYNPAINQEVFPHTPSDWFWTASPYAPNSYDAWIVSFGYGDDSRNDKSLNRSARLVRPDSN